MNEVEGSGPYKYIFGRRGMLFYLLAVCLSPKEKSNNYALLHLHISEKCQHVKICCNSHKNQILKSSSQYLFPSLFFWYFAGDIIEWWCDELVTGSTSVSTSEVVWHAEILLMELLGRSENKQFYLCKSFSSHD